MANVTMLLDNDLTRDPRVRKECRTLSSAGHRVRVIALRTPGSARMDCIAGAEVTRVAPARWSGLRGPGRIAETLGWYQRLAPLGVEAVRHPADVVHAHDLTTLGPAVKAARSLSARLVYDDHELYTETLNTTYPRDRGRLRTAGFRLVTRWLAALGTHLERRWVTAVDGHVTVSESIAGEIARRYRCARPEVVANCPPLAPVPPRDGRLRRALGAAADDRICLYQGTMPASGAGLTDLVDAVGLLPSGYRLAFMGWGVGKGSLERRVRERGLAERVSFLPPVPPGEVAAWIADADVCAVPNRPVNLSNELALPNKLFESMMAAVPVVAADTVEVRRVLREYPAGETYPQGDVEALAERIAAVAGAEPGRLAAYRSAARRGATEAYCWERQESTLLAVYERILSR